jgi:molybdopterin converting factor small subunit
MAKILIPTPLRQFTGKQSQVDAPGKTVAAVLDALTAQHADLRKHLYNDAGALRSYVNIYVNDEDIRYLQKSETPVTDADTLTIVPSIAGGSATLTEPMAAQPTQA